LVELIFGIAPKGQRFVFFIEIDSRAGALEVETVVDLARSHVDRVLHGDHIGFGGEVKRRHGKYSVYA